MSRGRRRREEIEASTPASTSALWLALFNGFFALLFAAALAGFVYLVVVGWWRSPLELLVAAVLIATAAIAAVFCLEGIRHDLREVGWTARGELRALGNRIRRSSSRPAGRESFASQRFTRNGSRRRR